MTRPAVVLLALVASAGLPALLGCNAQASSGGSGLIPVGQSGDEATDDNVLVPGTGGGDAGDTDASTSGDGDTGSNGNDNDGDTNGGSDDGTEPDAGDGTTPDGGDGQDGSDGVSPPTVILSVSNLSPAAGDTIFLTCVVTDSGGSPPTSYHFDSSIGTGSIIQNGTEIASADVLASPQTVNYWCHATNEAGQGPQSNLVIVTVSGSGF